MNTAKQRKASLPERGFAWAAAFLLALFLVASLFSLLAVQVMTSAGLHTGTATNDSVLDGQMKIIHNYIGVLADAYGFEAETVRQSVSREELRDFNLNAAAWWTGVLAEGESRTIPRWYSPAMEQAIRNAVDSAGTGEDPNVILAEITEKIDRTVYPLRESLLTTGLDFVNKRADIPGIVRSLRQVPPLCLVLCILAAGLIALLAAREVFSSLKYYGTALAGAGLVLAAAGIIYAVMQLKAMLSQASANLADEFGTMMHTLFLEAGGAAAVLLLAGFACLFIYRNRFEKHMPPGEEQAV